MIVGAEEREVVMLVDRGACWPRWLTSLPDCDSMHVHVREVDESWVELVRRGISKLGAGARRAESAGLILSLSSERAAEVALEAVEPHLTHPPPLDVVVVSPSAAVSQVLLAHVDRLIAAGARNVHVETRPLDPSAPASVRPAQVGRPPRDRHRDSCPFDLGG